MRTSISITIPEPCHEDWNKMTPRAQGKHCAACSKTVFNFTNKTDEHIVKTFETEGNICGRFNIQQLNRELVFAQKKRNNYLSLLASGVFAFMALGNQNSFAQRQPKTEQLKPIQPQQVVGRVGVSVLSEKVIYGIVTTAEDNIVLPGSSVIIKGTERGTQTNFDGKFSLRAKVGDTLIISYIGTKTQEIKIQDKSQLKIALAYDLEVLEETVVLGYPSASYIRKAKRKSKREAIKNGKRQRTILGKFFNSIKQLFSKREE